MGRPVILGNSKLTVGLNEQGLVHDFYYPYVGLENLTTARSMHHKIGIWVDGEFSWTDSDIWRISLTTSAEAMVSTAKMVSDKYKIELIFEDFVDYELDYFGRKISLRNTSSEHKEVCLFMHQVFEISREGRADTAFYVPGDEYILDYKGTTCLLISGKKALSNEMFDQFAVGNYGIEGKSGTYMDAEDGNLSGHSVEHGGVDSVIRFKADTKPDEDYVINYWIVASDTQIQCEKIHNILKNDFDDRLKNHKEHWAKWLAKSDKATKNIDEKYKDMVKKSLFIIKAHTDIRGGVIASCDSSIYNYGRDYYSYVWPRDGAYAMWPLIRLGYYEEPRAFFNFCADIASKSGFLLHKYQPDRAIGSTWHPLLHGNRRELAIQEDETAIVIIILGELFYYSDDKVFVQDIFNRFVIKAVEFLYDFIDTETGLPHASYDLWEEKFLTSTYTTACVYRALIVASDLGEILGHNPDDIKRWKKRADTILKHIGVFVNPDSNGLRKGFLLDQDTGELNFDNTLDLSSFYGSMVFGYYPTDAQHLHNTVREIESNLLNQTPSKGSPRYENDGYFKISKTSQPNSWIITTLWLGQYYLRNNQVDKTVDILKWVHEYAIDTGAMPEQIHPENGIPISVTPLVWSHAEYINTVLDLTNKTNH